MFGGDDQIFHADALREFYNGVGVECLGRELRQVVLGIRAALPAEVPLFLLVIFPVGVEPVMEEEPPAALEQLEVCMHL